MRLARVRVLLPRASAVLASLGILACGETSFIKLLPLEVGQPQHPGGVPGAGAGGRSGEDEMPTGASGAAQEAGAGGMGDLVDTPELTDAGIAGRDSGVLPSVDAAGVDGGGMSPAINLVHHYDFSGTGDIVKDLVGDADGIVLGGAELDGSGTLWLDGVDDYVDLPDGFISRLDAVTVTAWIVWGGGECWQRVFDFGDTEAGVDVATVASSSLFLTPSSCPVSHVGRVTPAVISGQFHVGNSVYNVQLDIQAPAEKRSFLALSAHPGATRGLTLFSDGQTSRLPAPLDVSRIQDKNNWLGRSQWSADPYLLGGLEEIKIYDLALEEEQLQALYEAELGQP